MSQLITTTNISNIKPVFTDEPAENIKRYTQLKKLLEYNDIYRLFAEPIISPGNKIAWNTEYEGVIEAFAKLNEEDKQFYLPILKHQVNKIYKTINKITDDINQREEIIKLVDSCLEIPTYDDIYLIQNKNGEINFCLVNWGFILDTFNAPEGLIKNLIPVKVADVYIKVIKGNNKIASNQEIYVKINNQEKKLITDNEGKITLNDIPLYSVIEIYTIINDEENNKKAFTVDDDLNITYNIEKEKQKKQEVTIQILDNKEALVPNFPLKISYEDVEFISETDKDGKLYIGELYVDTEVTCSYIYNNKILQTEKFTVLENKNIYFLRFSPNRMAGDVKIRIIDENRQPIPFATISVKIDNYVQTLTADENGEVVLANVKYREDIVIRQIIDKVPQFQKIYKFTEDTKQIEFIGKKTTPANNISELRVYVYEKEGIPLKNILVEVENGMKKYSYYTNNDGLVVFRDLEIFLPTTLKIDYKGHKINKKITLIPEKTETNIYFKEAFNYKILLFVLLLILGTIGIFLLLKNINFDKIFKPSISQPIGIDSTLKPKEPVGLQLKVIDSTNKPIANCKINFVWNNKPFSFITDSLGQAQLEMLTDTTKFVTLSLEATGFAKQEYSFKIPKKEKVIVLSKISKEFTEEILPCGTKVESKGYRSTIKTFKMPTNQGTFSIAYNMREVPDEIIIYNGPSWEINADKIVWRSGMVAGYRVKNISFNSADSLVTVEIRGNETQRTEWDFVVNCKPYIPKQPQ